jgi:hypothetical protein
MAAMHRGRLSRADSVHILAGAHEERTSAAVEPAAIDEQGFVAIIEGRPLDLVLFEVQLGHPIGDPVKQLEAIGVGTIHYPQSERRSGWNSGSPTPAARRLRATDRCELRTITGNSGRETDFLAVAHLALDAGSR